MNKNQIKDEALAELLKIAHDLYNGNTARLRARDVRGWYDKWRQQLGETETQKIYMRGVK